MGGGFTSTGMRLKFKDLYEANRVGPAINAALRDMPRELLDDGDGDAPKQVVPGIKKKGHRVPRSPKLLSPKRRTGSGDSSW